MKAIILAAGLGTRLRPMTENTPKALVQVNQKPLIEYQIEFLKEKGIHDIIIIVGYLKEQFDYLKEKYGVRLVFNDKYADYNNFYSLYLVKEELANSYVIDADNYLFKNMFRNDLTRSTYFSVYREDCTNEWFLVYGDDYKVQDITVDSKAGRILVVYPSGMLQLQKRLSALSIRLMQVANLLISTGTIWLRITSKS